MKDLMIDMMVSMMPYMKPLMWTGAVIATIAMLMIIINLIMKKQSQKMLTWSGRFVLAVAFFFLSSQVAGYFLSMSPTINFGDASKYEFKLVSFWQIGLGFLIAAIIITFLPRLNKQSAA